MREYSAVTSFSSCVDPADVLPTLMLTLLMQGYGLPRCAGPCVKSIGARKANLTADVQASGVHLAWPNLRLHPSAPM